MAISVLEQKEINDLSAYHQALAYHALGEHKRAVTLGILALDVELDPFETDTEPKDSMTAQYLAEQFNLGKYDTTIAVQMKVYGMAHTTLPRAS